VSVESLIYFDSDITLRWACRAGDYIIWARCQGLVPPDHLYKPADIWELRDGNFVTITNRRADLPEWFELHPLEVSNTLVPWMMKRLEEGYKPKERIDLPNLWRVFSGDRIVWIGPIRGGFQTKDGVLVEFTENALVYGEPFDLSDGFPAFGGFDRTGRPPEGIRLCRAGWNSLCRLGIPRAMTTDDQRTIG